MKNIHLPPSDAKTIEVTGSTVDFVQYKIENIDYISFDTSDRGAPEPMQNALLGLRLIKDSSSRLVMLNHRVPEMLLNQLVGEFEYIKEILGEELVAIEFFVKSSLKSSSS